MSRSLFTLSNRLPAGPGDAATLDLNPAVVADGERVVFALSAVCVGPSLASEAGRLELELVCDGRPTLLQAIEQRREDAGEARSLTVALFDAPRRLLDSLVDAAIVEVRFRGDSGRIERRLGRSNRTNLQRFLDYLSSDRPAREPSPVASAAS